MLEEISFSDVYFKKKLNAIIMKFLDFIISKHFMTFLSGIIASTAVRETQLSTCKALTDWFAWNE